MSVVILDKIEAWISPDIVLRVDHAAFEGGRLHLLVGRNASGKSSLLRTMLGFQPISSGQLVWSLGTERIRFEKGSGTNPQLFRQVGYVQQGSDSLWPHLTAYEHVEQAILARLPHLNSVELESHVRAVLQKAQVAPENWSRTPDAASIDGLATALSGGERQRISYARAIAADPKVLIFDELESSLDESVRGQFVDSIVRDFLGGDGSRSHTAFIVTHDPASWLAGDWSRDERQIWRVRKGELGEITLARDMSAEMPHPNLPQETLQLGQELERKLNALKPQDMLVNHGWQVVGWHLSVILHDFICALLARPRNILTVVCAGRSGGGADVRYPLLLGALGPPGLRPDGADRDRLRSFLADDGTFPVAAQNGMPRDPQDLPPRGLIVRLLTLDPDQAYKGNRIDHARFPSRIETETYVFSPSVVGETGERRDSYLELSKETKSVYLFRAIRSRDAQIVAGIDFLDERSLDRYQCFIIMKALERALTKLTRDTSK